MKILFLLSVLPFLVSALHWQNNPGALGNDTIWFGTFVVENNAFVLGGFVEKDVSPAPLLFTETTDGINFGAMIHIPFSIFYTFWKDDEIANFVGGSNDSVINIYSTSDFANWTAHNFILPEPYEDISTLQVIHGLNDYVVIVQTEFNGTLAVRAYVTTDLTPPYNLTIEINGLDSNALFRTGGTFGNGIFVICTNNTMYSSINATEWLTAPVPAVSDVMQVVFMGNLFFFFGENLTNWVDTTTVYISKSGQDWIPIPPFVNVQYVPDLNLYFGFSVNGTASTSQDGLNWTDDESYSLHLNNTDTTYWINDWSYNGDIFLATVVFQDGPYFQQVWAGSD